jgi:hypothetical protein
MKTIGLFSLLIFVQQFAYASSPDTVAKLDNSQFSCQLERLERQHGSENAIVFVPERPLEFQTSKSGNETYKSKQLNVPTDANSTSTMGFGCLELTEKSVVEFDDESIVVKVPSSGFFDFNNWGTLKVDLISGKGSFSVGVHYGWHPMGQDRDVIKADFSHCRLIK